MITIMSALSFEVRQVLGYAKFSMIIMRISVITSAKSSFFPTSNIFNNSKKFAVLTSSKKNFVSKIAAFIVLKINVKKVY